ncbi:hypothetical protein C4K26_2599 [Pseudomonas chlororaphis]|nr:hypothetical protein C4K26_2599 [Pseudomonas chlororaphis]
MLAMRPSKIAVLLRLYREQARSYREAVCTILVGTSLLAMGP